MDIYLPGLLTVSESNTREHWTKAHARHKKQKEIVLLQMLAQSVPKKLPVAITFVRLGPRCLDDDNLASAFKYIRDTVADYLIPGLAPGRADNDPRITWHYEQEKSSIKGIKIRFYWPVAAELPLSLKAA